MSLLLEIAIMLLILDVQARKHKDGFVFRASAPRSIYSKHVVRPAMKDATAPLVSYTDAFIPGASGKPTLGTMSATCWARGGICIEIRECPSLKIDVSVAGCSWGHKVCCKVHETLSPTVGRRARIPTINRPEDLGSVLQIIAYRNSLMLSNIDNESNEVVFEREQEADDEIDSDST